MTAPFELIPFDPGNLEHQDFVYDTFRKSTNHWPWSGMNRPRLMDRLKRELATPGTETRIATPQKMGDSFLGWYSTRPAMELGDWSQTVVYAFTRYSARRQGVATAALRTMGVHRHLPVGVLFWTVACARIVPRWKLYFDTRGAFDEEEQQRG